MPLRALLRMLEQNPQLVDKLSKTRPVRLAAKFGVGMYHKARAKGLEKMEDGPMKKMLEQIQEQLKEQKELPKPNKNSAGGRRTRNKDDMITIKGKIKK